LPALLAVTMLAAGCAGGAIGTPSLSQQAIPNAPQSSQRFSTTAAPAEGVKKIDATVGAASQTPTWQFIEPLRISESGAFSPAQNSPTCSPIDPIFGVWYLALSSFSLPMSSVSSPSCAISANASRASLNVTKNHPASIPLSTPGLNSDLYIVELSVAGFDVNVTPIAGPAVTLGSNWSFQPMENVLSFNRVTLYSFFVAKYNGPQFAQPAAVCGAGSTSCSLDSNPTAGNKLVVVVSDGSYGITDATVADSAGNVLTLEMYSPNCGHCVAIFDETVPPGITGTVTWTWPGGPYNGPYYPNVSAVYELANVTSGQFSGANTIGVPSSLATTISGVTSNDVQLCAYIQTGVSTGNVALTFSNGTAQTYDYQSTFVAFAHEIASANESSSCTAGNISADYQAAIGYADYR
jgi:hypothetical protein